MVITLFTIHNTDTPAYNPELEEQFALADVDRNGYIDNNELKKILTNLNMYHTDEEIAEMIHQADINGVCQTNNILKLYVD